MLNKWFSALAVLALLGTSAFMARDASAQHFRGRDRVCVYEHANYQGWEQCYDVGEEDRDLGNRRNGISSIRVQGRAQIILFEHPQFGGHEVRIDSDVSDLNRVGGWNDQVDSLRVIGDRGGPRDDPRWGGGGDRDGDREDRVCVYKDVGFQGDSQCFGNGDDVADLKSIGWNDKISSIRTFGRTRVAVFEHANFGGQNLVIDRDIPDLTQINFNDRISSLRVGDGGGKRRRDR
jgi:hypothetical protein